MGLFSRKQKNEASVSNSPHQSPVPTTESIGWILRGGSDCAFTPDASWAETIRASSPKVPRVGHSVTVELRRDKDGTVTVWHNGQNVGAMSSGDSKAYESALAALERSNRHGIVNARIEPTEWKSGGASYLNIAPPQRPCIPFNQPPKDIPVASRADFEVKDEAKFKEYIVRISRQMNASPGFFVIAQADNTGSHPVYAPLNGVSDEGSQVGYVNKAGTKAAAEATKDGPVYLPGMVWWRDSTPQVELASWLG